MAQARVKEYERKRSDQDALNARNCQIMAGCGGMKDPKMKDFMIFLKNEPDKPQSPKDWNNSLSAWAR